MFTVAIMSAMSVFCMEGAGLNAAAVTTSAASAMMAVAEEVQEAAADPVTQDESTAEDRLAPLPAEDLPAEAIANTPDNIVLDEEQFSGPLAFEGAGDDEVAAGLIDYLEGIDTLQGDFTQIAPSGKISTGRFYLRRPGFLRFEYDPPEPLLIVANSGMVYVRDDALETTDSYPVKKTPLKFLLRKKVDLEQAEIRAVDRGVDTVAVTFASDEEETEGELSIIVSAPEMSLKRWIVRDTQHGITIVTLDNVVAGRRLANRLFETPDAGGAFLKN